MEGFGRDIGLQSFLMRQEVSVNQMLMLYMFDQSPGLDTFKHQ